jgi:hypothetical protein
MAALDAEWEQAVGDQHRVRRQIVVRDRNDPTRHLVLVFFDSAADAAYNSDLPGTTESAAKYTALMTEPPTFIDCDVIEDRTY